jgi:hypothetical protein
MQAEDVGTINNYRRDYFKISKAGKEIALPLKLKN